MCGEYAIDGDGGREDDERIGRGGTADVDDVAIAPSEPFFINACDGCAFAKDVVGVIEEISLDGDGHAVDLIGRTEKGEPYLQVQDSGIGMEEADIAHMFERFYRSDDARKYKGTGLGLSIAKSLVGLMGGYFYLKAENGLFTVEVEFPVKKE